MQSLYEPIKANEMHIDDYESYDDLFLKVSQALKQNSFLQNDIFKAKGIDVKSSRSGKIIK